MATTKFEKNSKEWKMFKDFYQLCETFWEPEGSDDYWEELILEQGNFCRAYAEIARGMDLTTAFVNTQERRLKAQNGGKI